MSAHDTLVDVWRHRLTEGITDDFTAVSALRPESFCVVLETPRTALDGTPSVRLTPQCFAGPADFVAHLRIVELPRSLRRRFGVAESCSAHPPAEVYEPLAGADSEPLVAAAIAAADAALAKPEVAAADAERVIGAFNALFGTRGTRFVASGGRAREMLDELSGS